VSWINGRLGALFDVLLVPLADVTPWVCLGLFSLVSSVGILLLFKATSDQKAVADVKRRIHACLFEIRLMRDDAGAILRAQAEMLRHQGRYLRLGVLPLVLAALVLVPVIAQLQFRYGYQGLAPGHETIVTVRVKQAGATSRPDARLDAPAGVTVASSAVWLPALRELCWRVRAERPGSYRLTVHIGGETLEKSLVVSNRWERRSPVRLEPGLLGQILYPAEDPLPGQSTVESIAVAYPSGAVPLFGLQAHWLVIFFVLSAVFTLALRSPLRVVL
jgi:hypothetical protein